MWCGSACHIIFNGSWRKDANSIVMHDTMEEKCSWLLFTSRKQITGNMYECSKNQIKDVLEVPLALILMQCRCSLRNRIWRTMYCLLFLVLFSLCSFFHVCVCVCVLREDGEHGEDTKVLVRKVE